MAFRPNNISSIIVFMTPTPGCQPLPSHQPNGKRHSDPTTLTKPFFSTQVPQATRRHEMQVSLSRLLPRYPGQPTHAVQICLCNRQSRQCLRLSSAHLHFCLAGALQQGTKSRVWLPPLSTHSLVDCVFRDSVPYLVVAVSRVSRPTLVQFSPAAELS